MASGLEVAEVVRRYGAAYRQAQAGHLGRVERRVMGAIEACRTAAMSSVARTAGWSASPITRAATGIARSARGWLAPSGWRNGTMPSCSGRPPRRCARSPPTHATWVPRSVSSRFCTPGDRTCIITPTSIAWFPAADCRSMARVGSPAGQASSCRCACSRGSSGGCSWSTGTLGYGDLASLADQAAFERHLGGLRRLEWASTPSRPLVALIRSSPISAVTPSCCHRQQSARQARTGTDQLPVAGLSAPRQAQGDDPCRQRLHLPLPLAYAAGWLPPHPPLWLPGQWPPPYQARPMPTASCCAAATGRLSRALSTAHRRLARYLSVLWRRDAAAGTSPAPRSTEHAQLVR
jgi:hypothetical protein